MKPSIDTILERLRQSAFRAKFRLGPEEMQYLLDRSRDHLRSHAAQIINERLAPADHPKDGKQTPWRGHPVFVAQHATATCCRGCLAKWHRIPKGHALSAGEQAYVVNVIARWIELQMLQHPEATPTPSLFD